MITGAGLAIGTAIHTRPEVQGFLVMIRELDLQTVHRIVLGQFGDARIRSFLLLYRADALIARSMVERGEGGRDAGGGRRVELLLVVGGLRPPIEGPVVVACVGHHGRSISTQRVPLPPNPLRVRPPPCTVSGSIGQHRNPRFAIQTVQTRYVQARGVGEGGRDLGRTLRLLSPRGVG